MSNNKLIKYIVNGCLGASLVMSGYSIYTENWPSVIVGAVIVVVYVCAMTLIKNGGEL